MAGDHQKNLKRSRKVSRKPARKSSRKSPLPDGAGHLRTVHHEGFDPAINSLFVPAIKVETGKLVFISGVTCAPVYHQHPHRPEDFDAIPGDAAEQAVT